MIPAEAIIDLSRLQFALTAMYHFIFVPLTLGLSVMLGIMETIYVMTGRTIWREMTKYWGILFGINFAMGVATGITMEFQFGTNWAYYSQYVGDIFGVPLAIEGLMAFFLEATFVGLFFFGWQRLSQKAHLVVTWLLALGTSFSALWILIANGWMQNPVGAKFNVETMRMEVDNFADVIFNPVAQAKFVHTVSAGYVTGAVFVLAVSAYFLLRKRNIAFAKRSMLVASAFGLASALSVVVLGDESGYVANESQEMKLAAMEAQWNTEPAPASLTIIGWPDAEKQETRYAIRVPYLLGLIATRSFSEELTGINQLVEEAKGYIKKGMLAYDALQQLKQQPHNKVARTQLDRYVEYLGYGLLLKRYTDNVIDATPEQIQLAANDTVPKVLPLFFAFRIMVACGFFFIFLFVVSLYLTMRGQYQKPWFLRMAFWSLPLPWIAIELGWVVAEYGRQPWAVEGMLPTRLGVSSISLADIGISLAAFVVFYTLLAIVEFYLMVKYIRAGPDGLQMLADLRADNAEFDKMQQAL
jgi:cytochrome bd ubiquinol oxidase subunit I